MSRGSSATTRTNLYVLGNYIGVNATGTAEPSGEPALQEEGLLLTNCTNVIVSAPIAGAGNVIAGLYIGSYPSGTTSLGDDLIRGNKIGVNVTGLHGLPETNEQGGIDIYNSTGNVVGGTSPGDGNEIALQGGYAAISLGTQNPATDLGTVVEGNIIGTDPTGTVRFNEQFGINITSSDNAIGGLGSGTGNLITDSTTGGIQVGSSSVGNKILSNDAYNNGGANIVLIGATIATTPTIAAAYPVATGLLIQGGSFISGTPGLTYVVQIFDDANGQTLLGTLNVTTGANGEGTFAPLLPVGVAPGQSITATVTGGGGNTTAYSTGVTVSPQPTTSLALSASPASPSPGQPVTLTATATPSVLGLGDPAGVVVFKDGPTVLGTASLNASGQASFTSTFTAGTHFLTAVYTGGPIFPGAVSGVVLSKVVAVPPTVLGLALGPANSKRGGPTIVLTFSTALNSALASNPGFYELVALKLNRSHILVPSGNPIRIAAVSYVAGSKTVVLTPSAKLNAKVLYRLTVTGLTDVYGTPLAGGVYVGDV